MAKRSVHRRTLLASSFASLFAGDAAQASGSGERQVQINLAGSAPPPPTDGNGPAVIPAAADPVSRMTVPVSINEKGPYGFVVDTGANRSVISSEVALALKLEAGAGTQVHGIAGMLTAQTVRLTSLSVGDVHAHGLELPTLSTTELGAPGLLGVDVMKDRSVLMDFRLNRLEIGRSREGSGVRGFEEPTRSIGLTSNVVSIPARYRFGQLTIIDADVAGVPVTAFLDSGSQNTVANLALRNDLFGRRPLLATSTRTVELLSATGQTAVGEFCVLPSLRLGGLTIGNVSAVFASLHTFDIWQLNTRPAILIGVDVLRHFDAVELDFSRRLVVFHAPGSATEIGRGYRAF